MAALWVNSDVLDNGLQEIVDNCDAVWLVSVYAAADSYATVEANKVAEAACTSADFTLGAGDATNSRRLTGPSGKSDAAASASTSATDLQIAFVDTVNERVLWVADETSNQNITSGNPVSFPNALYLQFEQPTAA